MKRHYETKRLNLEILREKDASKVLDFYLRNKTFLEPWEHEKKDFFYTIENHRVALKLENEAFERGDMARFWIFSKQDTYKRYPIGSITISNIIRGAFKSCFLGYKMDFAFEGRGYMTEAIEKIVAIAFEELGLHRIEANIMPRNLKSLRVVEKNGFVNEGLGKKYLNINGKWEDHYHMVLLNETIE